MTPNWLLLSAEAAAVISLVAAASAADRPRFDAVSLRLNSPGDVLEMEQVMAVGTHVAPGSVTFSRVLMKTMIRRAYGVEEFQIPPVPWASDIYSGRATFPKETPLDQVPRMMRTMLEERFGLRAHMESKVVKVWLLEQAPGGAKLSPSSGKPLSVQGMPSFLAEVKLGEAKRKGNADPEREWLVMSKGTLRTFCALLSKEAKRPVIDRTGLDGEYDVYVEAANAYRRYIPPPSMTLPRGGGRRPDPPLVLGPALKKLGLKFRESREPVELLIVDTPPSLRVEP
jgi:uncharacterized protein (TIGR03435 family)